jgi:hypothetical protein
MQSSSMVLLSLEVAGVQHVVKFLFGSTVAVHIPSVFWWSLLRAVHVVCHRCSLQLLASRGMPS